MNSEQEKILLEFCTHSMGAPFVFCPLEYQKGNAIREPADLVWATNNVIVLLYGVAKRNNPSADTEVIQGRKNKLIEHNLSQARGWLSEWRNGRTLLGRNEFQEFNIKNDDYKFCVILSVIDYGQEEGWYHHELADEFEVSLCATISQKAFEYMVRIGCTHIDTIDLLLMLKKHEAEGSKGVFLNFVQAFHHVAVSKADPHNKIFKSEGNLIYRQTERYLRAFRTMLNANTQKTNTAALELTAMFNDFGLEDFIRLNVVLTSLIERWESDNGYCAVLRLFVKKYVVLLGITANENLKLSGPQMVKALDQFRTDSGVISILYDGTLQVPIISFFPRTNESQVESLLTHN